MAMIACDGCAGRRGFRRTADYYTVMATYNAATNSSPNHQPSLCLKHMSHALAGKFVPCLRKSGCARAADHLGTCGAA
jgi:hypothetical protein